MQQLSQQATFIVLCACVLQADTSRAALRTGVVGVDAAGRRRRRRTRLPALSSQRRSAASLTGWSVVTRRVHLSGAGASHGSGISGQPLRGTPLTQVSSHAVLLECVLPHWHLLLQRALCCGSTLDMSCMSACPSSAPAATDDITHPALVHVSEWTTRCCWSATA